jgi:hypothetical protein
MHHCAIKRDMTDHRSIVMRLAWISQTAFAKPTSLSDVHQADQDESTQSNKSQKRTQGLAIEEWRLIVWRPALC